MAYSMICFDKNDINLFKLKFFYFTYLKFKEVTYFFQNMTKIAVYFDLKILKPFEDILLKLLKTVIKVQCN